MRNKKNQKVIVAMSGGVDSSVAAALLKKEGFEVIGVFLKFWKEGDDNENRCCSSESERMAREVANKIGIPFYVFNAEREFKAKVVDYFLEEYKKGRTPNPCIICNKEIKFEFLLKKAFSWGAEFIATGHYARIKNGRLLKGVDKNKDQSYFLWRLNKKYLDRILFPVGEYTKPEIRKLAQKFRLPTAKTLESQEICFVKNKVNSFIKEYLKTKPGKIIDTKGKIIGEHQGLWFYTIGQRKGLGIPQGPWFVIDKNFKKNILIVSNNPADLERKELTASDVNWLSSFKLPNKATAKIRYQSRFAKVRILPNRAVLRCQQGFQKRKESVRVIFQTKQKAITPGQSVVFYKGQEVVGGGIID